MTVSKSGRIRVDVHQFAIDDQSIHNGRPPMPPEIQHNLVGTGPGQATIVTGVHTGTVSVTWTNVSAPVSWQDDAEQWDCIAEFSIVSDGTLKFTPIFGEADTIGKLLTGPASVRVLMRVRNRMVDYDDVNENSTETYDFTAWPDGHRDLEVHRRMDGYDPDAIRNIPKPPPIDFSLFEQSRQGPQRVTNTRRAPERGSLYARQDTTRKPPPNT